MKQNDIYKIIRNIWKTERINADGFFYGLTDKKKLQFTYCVERNESKITLLLPKNQDNEFIYVEINSTDIVFTKISNNGNDYEILPVKNEYDYFQYNTIYNFEFSYKEYKEIQRNFKKFYDGLIHEILIYV